MENLEKLLPQALMEANLLQFQDALKTDPPPDFSPRYREGQDEARALGLYMQKYCGCVFSEEDRYLGWKKRREARRKGL